MPDQGGFAMSLLEGCVDRRGISASVLLALIIISRKVRSLVSSDRRLGAAVLALCGGRIVPAVSRLLWNSRSRDQVGQMRWLRISSPMKGSWIRLQKPSIPWKSWGQNVVECWQGNCPCCKRPIDTEILDGPPDKKSALPGSLGKYAYVITLWGASKSYVLGAVILGHSIRSSGSPHSLVCLHTDDVPRGFVKLLSLVWDCRLIEHVTASKNLSHKDNDQRFEHVFTKLRALSLLEFEKVLMMDIDLLVMSNVDDLFELPAPAAMRRGMNSIGWGFKHGDELDGRTFFMGGESGKWSWGQGTGINAGVMLWQPDEKVLQDMLTEIAEPVHPAHIAGNGPEQDFLSRHWADSPWTHIGVENNYQLHQMFFALTPTTVRTAERIKICEDPSNIRIVHYSGEPGAKPWHRVLDKQFAKLWPNRQGDLEYTDIFAKEFLGYWLWIKRDKSAWDKAADEKRWNGPLSSYTLGDDGQLYQVVPTNGASPEATAEDVKLVDLPQFALKGTMAVLHHSLVKWFDAFESAEKHLSIDLVAALADAMPPPCKNTGEEKKEAAFSWKSTWFATPQRSVEPISSDGSRDTQAEMTHAWYTQYQSTGGWMHEESATWKSGAPPPCEAALAKASVVCGSQQGARFVVFSEGEHSEPWFPQEDEELRGVFVKLVGHGRCAARDFSIPNPSDDGDFSALRFWASGVDAGSVVLVAIVGLEAKDIAEALSALAPLGTPLGPVKHECRAFAAAGVVPADTAGTSSWRASHASVDVAYTSIPVPR